MISEEQYHRPASWNLWLTVTFLTFAVYAKTAYPSVPGGDSGELIVAAHEWGVAHPPGYPLFTFLARAAMTFIPGGSVAWRVNILCAILAAFSTATIYSLVFRLTGSAGAGLYSTVLFSFSHLTWTWSVTAEVFSLNNLFVAVIMCLLVKFDKAVSDEDKSQISKESCFGAFVCALGLCNQHTLILYVVPIAIWVLYSIRDKQMLSYSLCIKMGLCFLMGLIPYIYLPLSAYFSHARWTWGNHKYLMGFIHHLARMDYGTFSLGKYEEGLGLLYAVRAYSQHMLKNLKITGPVFAAIAVILSVRNRKKECRKALFVFISVLLLYTLFFAWRANLNLLKPLYYGVYERFWLQSDLVVSVLAGVGYHETVKFLVKLVSTKESLISNCVPFVGALVVLLAQMQNYKRLDQSQNSVVLEFGEKLLHELPQNSLVFTKGDLPSNVMRYLHLCEEKRSDVSLVDVEILSYAWSLEMLREAYTYVDFPGDFWYKLTEYWPDGRKSFSFQNLLDVNYSRHPIFVCIGMQDYDDSWKKSYELVPYGVCHKVVKKNEKLHPAELVNRTAAFADSWKYQYDQFDETSWEHVANGEMWHSKISTGFFLYLQSDVVQDEAEKVMLLLQALQVYKDAIKKNQEIGYPPFWHKNYALVNEKLMRFNHSKDKIGLCKRSIDHFNEYLTQSPDDPEAASIRSAVKSLTQWLKTVRGSDGDKSN